MSSFRSDRLNRSHFSTQLMHSKMFPVRSARNNQELLMAMRHGSFCRQECQNCPVTPRNCRQFRELWHHTTRCQNNSCPFPHCVSSRTAAIHFETCTDRSCPLCPNYQAAVRIEEENGYPQGSVLTFSSSSFTRFINDEPRECMLETEMRTCTAVRSNAGNATQPLLESRDDYSVTHDDVDPKVVYESFLADDQAPLQTYPVTKSKTSPPAPKQVTPDVSVQSKRYYNPTHAPPLFFDVVPCLPMTEITRSYCTVAIQNMMKSNLSLICAAGEDLHKGIIGVCCKVLKTCETRYETVYEYELDIATLFHKALLLHHDAKSEMNRSLKKIRHEFFWLKLRKLYEELEAEGKVPPYQARAESYSTTCDQDSVGVFDENFFADEGFEQIYNMSDEEAHEMFQNLGLDSPSSQKQEEVRQASFDLEEAQVDLDDKTFLDI